MSGEINRKEFVTATLVGAAASPILAASSSELAFAGGSTLAVYLHSRVRPWALNKAISEQLPGVDVTVYGRYRDFSSGVKKSTAVLAIEPVIAHYKLSKSLTGIRSGKSNEPYALVGIGKAPDPGNLRTLGVIDILGRSGTRSFVKSVMGGTSARLRHVTKVNDLLPLLLFKYVDAILAPTRLVPEFSAKTDLDLKSHQLSRSVGLPAVAATGAGGAKIAGRIKSFGSNLNKMLGVERWE